MNNGQQMESKKDQTEKILRLLTKRGFIGDEDINDEKIRSAQRERQKVAYHNTELLLKQYKNIAWMIECFPDTIAEELEQPFEKVDDVINRLDIEMSLGNRKVENRLASIRKTRLVLDRINDALSVLKKKPDDGERLYDLIWGIESCYLERWFSKFNYLYLGPKTIR